TVNWGDGSTPQTLSATATSASHAFTSKGNFNVVVTPLDSSGTPGTAANRSIKIVAAELEKDPVDPSKKALAVGGTLGNDAIKLVAKGGKINVTIGGASVGNFAPT